MRFSNNLSFLLLSFVISTTRELPAQTDSAPAAPLDLEAAVAVALQHSPAMRSVHAAQEAAEAAEREARSLYLPALRLQETLTRSDNPVFAFGSKLEQGRFSVGDFALDALNQPEPLTNLRSSFQVHANLFDLSQRPGRISAARAAAISAGAGALAAEQQTRFATIAAYLDVLAAGGQVGSAQASLETASAETQRLEALYQEGLVVESDLLSAQVAQAAFQQELIAAQGALQVAKAQLADVLGIRPAPELAQHELVDPVLPSLDPDELLRAARERHPAIQQRQSELEAAQSGKHYAAMELAPRLDGFAQWGYSSEALSGGSGDYALGLELVWDLFAPGRADRLAVADARLQIAEVQRDAQLSRVETAITAALADQATALAQLAVAREAENQAERALAIVRERHAAGLSTITELLSAQSALSDARQRRRLARHGALLGYALALLAAGRLEDVSPIAHALGAAP